MAAGGGTKAVVMALVANGGIAIAKFVGFSITGSSAMLAEAIHSVADTSNQGLLLLGGKRARRAANNTHQFGYGRERYFWAFVVALLLFSVGAGFALYEGIEKIRHPHDIDRWEIAAGILIFGIVLEGFAFYTAFKESLKIKPPEQTLWQFIRKTRNPELPVVLLEDSAAMLGLFVALAGIFLSIKVDPVFDGIATTFIGVLLAAVAVILAIEMKSLLIGESADETQTAKIVSAIEADSVVAELIDLKTMHTGPDDVLVVARVRFKSGLTTGGELAKEIDDLQQRIQELVPTASHIYIEPDLRVAAAATDAPDAH